MVKRIILFLLIATGGWWLYNGGAVSIANRLENFGEGFQPAVNLDAAPEDVLCLRGARDAYSMLESEVRRLPKPPLDEEIWQSLLHDANWEIRKAESTCGCPSHACAKARQAMEALREVVTTLGGMVGGSDRRVGNPANPLNRADELLDDARRLASSR